MTARTTQRPRRPVAALPAPPAVHPEVIRRREASAAYTDGLAAEHIRFREAQNAEDDDYDRKQAELTAAHDRNRAALQAEHDRVRIELGAAYDQRLVAVPATGPSAVTGPETDGAA